MWTREELKRNAKDVLRRSYWRCFLVCLVIGALCGELSSRASSAAGGADGNWDYLASSYTTNTNLGNIGMLSHFSWGLFSMIMLIGIILSIALGVFILNPLRVGKQRYFLKNITEEARYTDIISVFDDGNYLNVVKIMLLKDVKVFLWSLLFIFPGIYKSYQYQMIPYLLAEDSSLTSEEAFTRTKLMTNEEKFNIFVLDLSFIGWYLLGGLCLGIGGIFVDPYKAATDTELYICLKERTQAIW